MSSVLVGERIRTRREALGLSQRALAVPGVSAQYLSRIEHGGRVPSTKALRKIAGKLEVTPEWLEHGGSGLALQLSLDEARALREVLEVSDLGVQFCGQLSERLEQQLERTPA